MTGDQLPVLILASGSARRRELIARLVPSFRNGISEVEEEGSDLVPPWEINPLALPPAFAIDPAYHPVLWAWRKAADVARDLAETGRPLVLGADTVVIAEGRLLNKPGSPDEAAQMLRTLRGRAHYVATGYALVRDGQEGPETVARGATLSCVWMRDYSDVELEGYVATGEPLDKAGAYAVQGLGGALVGRVEGCYLNVVGLPLCEVREALEAAGMPVLPYPLGGYCDYCPLRLNR